MSNIIKKKHFPYTKFKIFMVDNGISWSDLSELLGLKPLTVRNKINGKSDLSYSEVEKICDKYKIKPEIFSSLQAVFS